MAPTTPFEQSASHRCQLLCGPIAGFMLAPDNIAIHFVHINLLGDRCPGNKFQFDDFAILDDDLTLFQGNVYTTTLPDEDRLSLINFVLWLYRDDWVFDLKGRDSDDSNTEFLLLHALAFAHRYDLNNYWDFIQKKFVIFSHAHYGGAGSVSTVQNLPLENLVFAYDKLPADSAVRKFLLEHFAYCMLYQAAYTDAQLERLTSEHPTIAADVMKRLQIIARSGGTIPALRCLLSDHGTAAQESDDGLQIIGQPGLHITSDGKSTSTGNEFRLVSEGGSRESRAMTSRPCQNHESTGPQGMEQPHLSGTTRGRASSTISEPRADTTPAASDGWTQVVNTKSKKSSKEAAKTPKFCAALPQPTPAQQVVGEPAAPSKFASTQKALKKPKDQPLKKQAPLALPKEESCTTSAIESTDVLSANLKRTFPKVSAPKPSLSLSADVHPLETATHAPDDASLFRSSWADLPQIEDDITDSSTQVYTSDMELEDVEAENDTFIRKCGKGCKSCLEDTDAREEKRRKGEKIPKWLGRHELGCEVLEEGKKKKK